MIRNSLLISFLFFFFVLTTSCSKNTYPVKADNGGAIVKIDDKVRKYNMKMDFGSKHFSGILMLRKMESGEIRILASTQFGLSLFDFGLNGEEWQVYSCIEPMRNKRVLSVFETDFKTLFLPYRDFKKIEKETDYTKYVVGSGFSKSVISVYPDMDNDPEKIRIRRSWWRLTTEFEKMDDANVTE